MLTRIFLLRRSTLNTVRSRFNSTTRDDTLVRFPQSDGSLKFLISIKRLHREDFIVSLRSRLQQTSGNILDVDTHVCNCRCHHIYATRQGSFRMRIRRMLVAKKNKKIKKNIPRMLPQAYEYQKLINDQLPIPVIYRHSYFIYRLYGCRFMGELFIKLHTIMCYVFRTSLQNRTTTSTPVGS